MNTFQPHIIQVGGVQYQLGELKNNCIYYDFSKILIYLQAKGAKLFGQNFKIYKEDHYIIYKLCCYAVQDAHACKKLNIDPNKGILLSGPVGCGKTSLMKLIRHIAPNQIQYKIIPCRNTVFSFNHIGYKTIEDYGNQNHFCFDDLGVEPTGRHFGKDCNVMGEILLSRYDLFTRNSELLAGTYNKRRTANHQQQNAKKQPPIITHATTNLNAKELEERYGNRVRSRMREMFNLIAFTKESTDKRK